MDSRPIVFMQILRADPRGTQFGCTAATPMTTHDITALDSRSQSDPQTPRQRERRQALSELLTGLTKALDRHGNTTSMRGVFEEMLGRALPVRSVQLHGTGTCWKPRPEPTPGTRTIALELPGPDSASKGVLEATFAPGTQPGEWDFQMLGLATHIGALVLEIDRSRTQSARAASLNGPRLKRDGTGPIIGSTPAIRTLRTTIERVAATDFTVLLEGESGVGKELVARQIHDLGRRRKGPFVAINCAALVDTLLEAELFGIEERTATGVRGRRGKFEQADGGTLFLDEVSDLSMSAQAKLLRTIQDLAVERVGGNGAHRVDIRIIAATNRSLSALVERQLFRPDLYYRLSGVDVRVPSLRERREDVLELSRHFLDRHRTMRSLLLSTAAADALLTYDWPGNVRELERLIERAVTLTESDVIVLDDLPATVRGAHAAALAPSLERNDTLRAWGSRYARLIVDRCGGNKRKACRVLGISYHTLQAYLRYRIHEPATPTDVAWNNEVTVENKNEVGTAAHG